VRWGGGKLHRYANLLRLKPARYPKRHLQAAKFFGRYDYTLPSFVQTGSIVAYTVLLALLCSIGFNFRHSDHDYTPSTALFIRWIALRTGIMAFAQFPLLILTSGSMYVITSLTKWSRDSWNIFHRAIGRLIALCAVTHGICYFTYGFMNGESLNKL
jgi:hypothetical protein